MTTTIGAAVAQRAQNSPPSIGALIQQMQPEIQRALPRGLSGDRMARLALTVLKRDPNLAACTPQSFAGALLTAASLGLEPGVNGEAYLVPYKGECSLIIGYQGYTKLFWQHPAAQTLNAQAVYERDEFEYAYGLAPKLHHVPFTGGDRGAVIFYYAAVSLSTGGQHFEVLTPAQVKELRGGKVGPSGKIADPMRWMERKTAIRQVLKPMPKSTQMAMAIDSDERDGGELYVERVRENAAEQVLSQVPALEPARPGDGLPAGTAVDTGTGEIAEPPAEFFDDLNAGR
jgi:recombination protein RecT